MIGFGLPKAGSDLPTPVLFAMTDEENKDTNAANLRRKFSFFPTVAHQTHLRVKELLDLKDSTQHTQFSSDDSIANKARQLVADHYPLTIIEQEGEGG